MISTFVSGKVGRKLNTTQSSLRSVNRWGFSHSSRQTVPLSHSPMVKGVPVAILSGSRMSKGN